MEQSVTAPRMACRERNPHANQKTRKHHNSARNDAWLQGTTARPDSGVEVQLTFIDSSRSPFKVVTNSEGEWEVDGLAGKVMIVPQKPGWVFDPASRRISGEDLCVDFSGHNGSGD